MDQKQHKQHGYNAKNNQRQIQDDQRYRENSPHIIPHGYHILLLL